MSEMKGMMDMMKNMAPDSAGAENPMEGMGQENSIATLGQEMSKVSESIKSVQGISDVIEIGDTANFKYGYTFKFSNVAALNRALKVINKEKYESKAEEVYKFSGKSFERLGAGDMGEELKKAMADSGGEDEGGSMEMVKMFFADMSYQQIYHFPDRKVKKSSNSISEISDDGHTLTINIKPFNEGQNRKCQCGCEGEVEVIRTMNRLSNSKCLRYLCCSFKIEDQFKAFNRQLFFARTQKICTFVKCNKIFASMTENDVVFHLNVASLDDTYIQDLKKQFGPAELEIHISKRPKDWFSETDFWKTIALFD